MPVKPQTLGAAAASAFVTPITGAFQGFEAGINNIQASVASGSSGGEKIFITVLLVASFWIGLKFASKLVV
jgi:hypothetical protein